MFLSANENTNFDLQIQKADETGRRNAGKKKQDIGVLLKGSNC